MLHDYMAGRWGKMTNATGAVLPGRKLEEITGPVARKNAKKVLELFLALSEQ